MGHTVYIQRFILKPLGKKPLKVIGCRWEDAIKIYLRKILTKASDC
jgi:hypothetical protein